MSDKKEQVQDDKKEQVQDDKKGKQFKKAVCVKSLITLRGILKEGDECKKEFLKGGDDVFKSLLKKGLIKYES